MLGQALHPLAPTWLLRMYQGVAVFFGGKELKDKKQKHQGKKEGVKLKSLLQLLHLLVQVTKGDSFYFLSA